MKGRAGAILAASQAIVLAATSCPAIALGWPTAHGTLGAARGPVAWCTAWLGHRRLVAHKPAVGIRVECVGGMVFSGLLGA